MIDLSNSAERKKKQFVEERGGVSLLVEYCNNFLVWSYPFGSHLMVGVFVYCSVTMFDTFFLSRSHVISSGS